MSDLIRRADAIKAIEDLPNAYNGWSDAYDKAYIIGTLEEVPKADRPQGEWVRAMDGYDMHVKCTSCFKTYDWDTQAQYYNYCPYCGARMKGADDDTDNV